MPDLIKIFEKNLSILTNSKLADQYADKRILLKHSLALLEQPIESIVGWLGVALEVVVFNVKKQDK